MMTASRPPEDAWFKEYTNAAYDLDHTDRQQQFMAVTATESIDDSAAGIGPNSSVRFELTAVLQPVASRAAMPATRPEERSSVILLCVGPFFALDK